MAVDVPHLQRASSETLSEQIARHYRTAIQQGRLRGGDRLPAIREVAGELSVTRNTVQDAYRRLAEVGLVSGTVGRGTMVLGAENAVPGLFSRGALNARRHLESAPQGPSVAPGAEMVADFSELLPDQQQFPVDEFRASVERVLRSQGGDLLIYGQPMGHDDLRRLLAERREGPEAACDPDQILITSGAQQGIDLVLRTFTSPGDAVAVTVPTYHHLFGLLQAHGLELVPIPTSAGGIDPAELERVLARPGVRLLCLMPTFHNPTGYTMDLAQREELMSVVQRTRVPVLEDEFQRELRFAGEPLPSLRSLDSRELTVTIRTFSKGLFPGVRTGWVQAKVEILELMAALKRVSDLETSSVLQAALVDFTQRGELDRHLEMLRGELRERHAAAQSALEQHMPPGVTWSSPEGGFALWVEGPPGLDADRLVEAAAARGVLTTPGRVFDPGAAPSSGLRLSLSRSSPDEVERGIAVLGACARELLAHSDPLRRPNFL